MKRRKGSQAVVIESAIQNSEKLAFRRHSNQDQSSPFQNAKIGNLTPYLSLPVVETVLICPYLINFINLLK